jgi:hypothetical protein
MRLASRKGMAWIALLALVGQLLLAFAHHHQDSGINNPALATFLSSQVSDDHQAPLPADNDKDCTICLVLALAASTIIPLCAYLLIQPSTSSLRWKLHAAASVMSRRVGNFEARAPPAP